MIDSSVDQLIRESRRLRDHLLHVSGQNSGPLTRALQPFEARQGDVLPDDAAILALADAFEQAHEAALRRDDGYTIEAVLAGNSPYRQISSNFAAVLLTAFCLLLIYMAASLTTWHGHAVAAIGRGEKFVEYQHLERVMQVAAMESVVESGVSVENEWSEQPRQIYLQGVFDLAHHYREEAILPAMLLSEARDVPFFNASYSGWLKRRFCPQEAPDNGGAASEGDQTAVRNLDGKGDGNGTLAAGLATANSVPDKFAHQIVDFLVGCPEPIKLGSGGYKQISTVRGAQEGEMPYNIPSLDYNRFALSEDLITERMSHIMVRAGRQVLMPYEDSRFAIEDALRGLRTEMRRVDAIWLPFVYGALGSAIYCLWRVLHPSVSQLRVVHMIMRTAFAGLAGLTFSILVLPANLLPMSPDTGRPLVYLIAFIFGYSVEAFTMMLNAMNRSLTERLSPQQPDKKKV